MSDEEDDFEKTPVETEESVSAVPVAAAMGSMTRNCTICLFPWTATGPHRICCLKCGHLYGKHCIERWVKDKHSCPECKQKAALQHIRVLFTANFAVADTAERDKAQEMCRVEKRNRLRLETENTSLKAQIARLSSELAREKKIRKVDQSTCVKCLGSCENPTKKDAAKDIDSDQFSKVQVSDNSAANPFGVSTSTSSSSSSSSKVSFGRELQENTKSSAPSSQNEIKVSQPITTKPLMELGPSVRVKLSETFSVNVSLFCVDMCLFLSERSSSLSQL
jgi:hypothetical protein